jgi:hypothetical protein
VAIWDFDAHHGNGTEEIVFGNIEYGLRRFTSIPVIQAAEPFREAMSSIGRSRPGAIPNGMRLPFMRHWSVYSNSTLG